MRIRGVIIVCLVVAGLLVVFFAGRRAVQVMAYPIGTGESKKSPDGRYAAHVTDWYDESYFGHTRQWFEFRVTGGSSQRLVTDPIPGPYFGSRSTNTIVYWADDSSFVRFVFPATEIRMKP
jgi:hypothetical protein